MRSKNLGAEEGFHEVCAMIHGPAAPKETRLNIKEFKQALAKLGFSFTND